MLMKVKVSPEDRELSDWVPGTLKFFDPVKGYGFIILEDGKEIYIGKATWLHSGFIVVPPKLKVDCQWYTHTNGKARAAGVRPRSVE